MSARNPDDRNIAFECLDLALRTHCANSAEVIRVAGEFFAFVTGENDQARLRAALERAGVI